MSVDTFSAFEEVELGNGSALRELRRRYVSFLTLLARYEGSVICICCHYIIYEPCFRFGRFRDTVLASSGAHHPHNFFFKRFSWASSILKCIV